MLDAEHPDAVSVCVPTALHLPVTQDVAAAGAHVLLEKPMAASVADCDAIAAACERAGVTLMVGFTHRFHRELIEAKRLIGEGAHRAAEPGAGPLLLRGERSVAGLVLRPGAVGRRGADA